MLICRKPFCASCRRYDIATLAQPLLLLTHSIEFTSMLPHKLRRWLPAFLAIATSMTIVITQSNSAQALNLGQLIPRILPNLIETIQLASISPKQEMALGQEINAQLTKQQMPPLRDSNLSSYVSDLGRQIASRSKRQEVNYTFQVVDDNNINAAATMGGFVYINKGTIMAADNESQLASVIAHEIAHIEGRHTIEQAKNNSLARTGAAALKLDKNTLIGLASRFALDMPRSRRFEMNADTDGLRMLRESCYDQQGRIHAKIGLWQHTFTSQSLQHPSRTQRSGQSSPTTNPEKSQPGHRRH
jgi:beta-barrel assembly-enhancing protease